MAHSDGTADEDSDGASAITPLFQREEMIFGLKALLVDSEQVLGFLASRDFSDPFVGRSFQQPDSRPSQMMEKMLWRLRDSCDLFGDGKDVIPITPKPAVQELVGSRYWQEVGSRRWRPDALFQLANLASFAAALLGPKAQSSKEFGVLHTMWEQFPGPFTYGFEEPADGLSSPGYSKLLNSTFEVGLELRTQFAIGLLSKRKADTIFDPNVTLNEVFYVAEDEHPTQLLGFNAKGLCVYERFLPENFQLQVLERIQAIQRHFSDHNDGSVDHRSLESSYPWKNFLCQVMSWVQRRAAELGQQIDDQGGLNTIQHFLREEARRQRTIETNADFEDQRSAPMGPLNQVGTPKYDAPVPKSMSNGCLVTAKPARKSLAEEAQRLLEIKAQVTQKMGNKDVAKDARALREWEFEDIPPLPAELEEVIERQSRRSNKENIEPKPRPKTFIDRQHGAKKINFDDDSQEVVCAARRGNGSSGKRPHSGSLDDEDDFGVTATDAADNRRRQLRQKTGPQGPPRRSSSKRFRSEIPESLYSAPGASFQVHDNPAAVQAAIDQQLAQGIAETRSVQPSQPSASGPSVQDPPRSTAEQIEYIRQSARDRVATREPRRVQMRTPYTLAEEERLITLIEEHGTSYSFIKDIDQYHPDGALLQGRSQVQLKDKAQDLKFQFLK